MQVGLSTAFTRSHAFATLSHAFATLSHAFAILHFHSSNFFLKSFVISSLAH